MKIARIIGLAAVAALALTAWAGAGSASAAQTTLCKTSTYSPTCNTGDRYAANTEIKASSTEFIVKTTGPNLTVACPESSFEGKTSAESGEPLSVSVSKWTFGKCEHKPAPCPTEAKSLPYAGSLAHTTGSDGTLTLGNGGGGEPRLFIKCGAVLNCEWQIPAVGFKGGSSGQITLPEVALTKKGGALCPTTATLKPASYAVSTPKPVYVSSTEGLHTRLCKEMTYPNPCKTENAYPLGTTIEAEAPSLEIKTTSPASTFKCGKTTVAVKTLAFAAEPLPLGPAQFTLTNCTSTFFGKCTVTSSSTENGEIKAVGVIEGLAQLRASWKFLCGSEVSPTECTLNLIGTQPQFLGSTEHPEFSYTQAKLTRENEACPLGNQLTATFTVTSPKPLFAS